MSVFPRLGAEPPANFTLRQQRDRAADELIGLCRGVLADGHVSSGEAQFIRDWIERHAHVATEYPFNYLYQRLASALSDGVLDPEEESDLLGTLTGLVGGETYTSTRDQVIASLSTTLPICTPPPPVVAEIEKRGGEVRPSVTKKTTYLVIGEIGSQAWKHSSYGRKIEAAVALRDGGAPLRILAEPHWVAQLS